MCLFLYRLFLPLNPLYVCMYHTAHPHSSRLRFGPSDGPDPDAEQEKLKDGHVRFACSDKLPALTVLTAHYRQKHREARLKRRLRRNKVGGLLLGCCFREVAFSSKGEGVD